jgi:hypothetical protein
MRRSPSTSYRAGNDARSDLKRRKLAAVALSLVLAAVAAVVPAAGCNGTGVTPVCAFPDGAFDPESGCDQPVEASLPAEDALADQGSQATEDAGVDGAAQGVDASDSATDSGSQMDAADAEKAMDAADGEEHDAHITDAHADAKG